MYKILLADNEGVVLDALINMIHSHFHENCDIRVSKTALYTRTLARKFVPDIAIINIQMPGMRGFEVVREIRSFHLKCIFITVSASDKAFYHTESKNLNILAHITKPLFREKVVPVLETAISMVAHSQKRQQQNRMVQERFDAAVPVVEHGLINQLFFPDSYAKSLKQYKTLLGISQNYGRIVTITFGELPPSADEPHAPADAGEPGGSSTRTASATVRQSDSFVQSAASGSYDRAAARALLMQKKDALQNPVGSAVHLQKDYMKFRETVLENLPQAVTGPVMGNHVLLIVPCWKETETSREYSAFLTTLDALTETLEDIFEGLSFCIEAAPVAPLAELQAPI
ncbi:response regulator transcription factor [Marvinbryantia formatexigens]|nr:response regulator [Marvinbryantia formatexigens]UWO26829.1 response regulator [Marvinbryantia formatexigens DSM 14469]SDH21246.1 Response regulator receiver domain-containing protein [Marvinbryantia formatexigens]